MNVFRRVDRLSAWWYCSRVGRWFRKWRYNIKAYRTFRTWWYRTRWVQRWHRYKYGQRHLYEAIVSNSRVWLKIQISCSSVRHAVLFLESRFNGSNYVLANGYHPVTPFRLSERVEYIANWDEVLGQLPAYWDENEYRMDGLPYTWCETHADGCDCHGSKGRLDLTYCSDHGACDESDKRKKRSRNIRHENYVKDLEASVERRDHKRRQEQPASRPARPGPSGGGPFFSYPKVSADHEAAARKGHVVPLPAAAVERIRQLTAAGYYCSIHSKHHAYGQQPIHNAVASLNSACEKASVLGENERETILAGMPGVAEHYLRVFQSEECAQRSLWGDAEIPDILYKYIPRELIGKGAPNSLRATQLLALNDDMECNVTTMKEQTEDTLDWLRAAKEKLEEHLDVEVPWDELLSQATLYGNPRLSPFIQKYLNPLVGVVSLTTDVCVPTMWAHYARNAGIVVGYDTEALKGLGFELRPVVYSEMAPVYRPLASDDIVLDFVDQEEVDSMARAGRDRRGTPILVRSELTNFGTGWKSLSRLLLVKGMSWAYEKEVRLLVDLQQARDIGSKDGDKWPIRVIEPPPEAIREIYRGANTRDSDVERAVQIARGEDRKGLFVGRLSSHAFRIQKTGGSRY